jgi:putative oxidoreductase
MVKFLSRYPDGSPGAGLLLLRFSCALVAYPVLARLPLPPSVLRLVLLPAAAGIALALALGFGTRTVALLLAVTALAAVPTLGADGAFMFIASAGGGGALALLGPGAYSIDARVFGRQVIRFKSRSPGSGDT